MAQQAPHSVPAGPRRYAPLGGSGVPRSGAVAVHWKPGAMREDPGERSAHSVNLEIAHNLETWMQCWFPPHT